MTFPSLEPSSVSLLRYSIAGTDAFDAQPEQRDVYVGRDELGRIRIWGEMANGGPSTKADLCCIFLEYSLYCESWGNATEAHYHMERFGEKLGHELASYLKQNPALLPCEHPTLSALELLFLSIGACYSIEKSEAAIRFLVTECPLEDTARRAGVKNLELARYGINSMCRSMLLVINPTMIVNTSSEAGQQFLFTLRGVTSA